MKLSNELVLRAVTAALEFNAENNRATASVNYSKDNLVLALKVFLSDDFSYYKVSTPIHADSDIYAESHEQNLADFLDALKSHTSQI